MPSPRVKTPTPGDMKYIVLDGRGLPHLHNYELSISIRCEEEERNIFTMLSFSHGPSGTRVMQIAMYLSLTSKIRHNIFESVWHVVLKKSLKCLIVNTQYRRTMIDENPNQKII